MYRNRYFTESLQIDITKMLDASPARMSDDDKDEWMEAFECLDEDAKQELIDVCDLMVTEKKHTPKDEDDVTSDEDDASRYFSDLADEFEAKHKK